MGRFFLVDKEVFISLFERRNAADAGTNDRCSPLAVLEGCFKTSLAHRLRSGDAGILRIPVCKQQWLGVASLSRVEIANFGADRDVQILQWKAADRTYA